ncbi:hypothetical protein DERF_009186 [Dermatophagoides farinae]|uniref:Uncharacterized protein n=1 Tax=Dermatophagoides farinae TaxID=6954 RepID=A0A922HYM0_DERFA|nr:hypothetical protein DERF_009186 [Dermatophagoides farinae]
MKFKNVISEKEMSECFREMEQVKKFREERMKTYTFKVIRTDHNVRATVEKKNFISQLIKG